MSIIYGVNTTEEISPIKVREAMVSCFFEAHCAQSGLEADKDVQKEYCTEIIKKAFLETGGEYDNPTKESIMKCVPWLANFSKTFRDQEIIQKHMNQIMELINLMK